MQEYNARYYPLSILRAWTIGGKDTIKEFQESKFFSQSSPKNQLGRGADWFKVILNFNGESQLEIPKKNRKNPHSFSIISSHILVL